jgi:uncharacterized protein
VDAIRPVLDSEAARTFWAGCADSVLLLPRCGGCGRIRWYLQVVCPWCTARTADWVAASGRGTIFAFTVVEREFDATLRSWVPYAVALVQLEESEHARFVTRIVGCDIDDIEVGMPVEVTFERVDRELVLPFFSPRAGDV